MEQAWEGWMDVCPLQAWSRAAMRKQRGFGDLINELEFAMLGRES